MQKKIYQPVNFKSAIIMPLIYNLGEYLNILKKVYLIIGEGLCSNIYVIGKEEVVLIDTGVGNHVNPIWPQLVEIGIHPDNVKGVILTHTHHDHAMGTFILLEKANPKIFISKIEAMHTLSLTENLVIVEDLNLIDTEIGSLRVLWTPGHTKGSICLYNKTNKILFSGDTVFPYGSFGRYDGDSGNLQDIIKSLEKLSKLDVDVMLPGHGYPVLKNASEGIKLSHLNAISYG